MKPLLITSLRIPEPFNARLCTVVGELLFFQSNQLLFFPRPPRIATWNAATNESRALDEIQPVPVDYSESFGGYMSKRTGELQLLVFNHFGMHSCRGRAGNLYLWERGEWLLCLQGMPFTHPNLNTGNGVVVFRDAAGEKEVHLCDVEKDSQCTKLEYKFREDLCEFEGLAREEIFHFRKHGSYMIGATVRDVHDFKVFWFDSEMQMWELVGDCPDEMSISACSMNLCSDGVENIWALSRSADMLRFNVVTKSWTRFPSCAAHNPASGVFHTTF